jgi:ubiquitin-like protein Pup
MVNSGHVPTAFDADNLNMVLQRQTEQRTRHRRRETSSIDLPAQTVSKDDLKREMDEILDEIDEVLEENAEEFVKAYVQKGGETTTDRPLLRPDE